MWKLVALLICGAQVAPPVAHTPISTVTWTQDVGPLVQRRCAGCHRGGGFGPMPLLTYADAKAAAPEIRIEVSKDECRSGRPRAASATMPTIAR